ncbi:hypothetical protein [Botrimarina mediterranea]|uniref:hypothetical protein n=1 Tax=Botrimarina mediterranea TaxID=2528022 RepID=UPI00119F014D
MDVSIDGGRVVGGSWSAGGAVQAIVWKEGLKHDLGGITVGAVTSEAYAVSDDGSTIVGTSSDILWESGSPRAQNPFVWDEEAGFRVLEDASGRSMPFGFARGVSAFGDYVVGQRNTGIDTQGFLWTRENGEVLLDDLPGSRKFGAAFAVSAYGNRIVGRGREVSGGNVSVAVIWDSQLTPKPLKGVLEDDYGLDLEGWTLRTATDISADGRFIVGTGRGPDGLEYVWRAEIDAIPEPTALLISLTLVIAIIASRGNGRLLSV